MGLRRRNREKIIEKTGAGERQLRRSSIRKKIKEKKKKRTSSEN